MSFYFNKQEPNEDLLEEITSLNLSSCLYNKEEVLLWKEY